jgi:hypothetical protein
MLNCHKADQPNVVVHLLHVNGLMSDDDLKSLLPNPKFEQPVTALKRPPTKVDTR